ASDVYKRQVVFIVVPLATFAAVGLALFSGPGTGGLAETASASFLCGGPIASQILTMSKRWQHILIACFTTAIAIIFIISLWHTPSILITFLSLVLMAWAGTGIIRSWLQRAIQQHEKLLAELNLAVQASMVANERESQRRYSARQLHDTVLSTLTMLAHSGKGIDPDALRAQAASDAEFLVHLRQGQNPRPHTSVEYLLEPIPETELSQTLESIRSRFQGSGLAVNWMGDGKILLPRERVDTLISAITECLENVRRHSGSAQAYVTISVENDLVRAIISDQGVGFDQHKVSEGLGLKESVIARMQELGGNARIFSEPGIGTTVILETPAV
ncbi:MAG: ATP-binding protein, partial [Microbacteriaceae bacterium]